MSALGSFWTELRNEALLDSIDRYGKTMQKKKPKERYDDYRQIATEVERKCGNDGSRLTGEDVRKQCESLVKTRAKYINPKLETFLLEGRTYLFDERSSLDTHVQTGLELRGRSVTVGSPTDLGLSIEGDEVYRDRYNLRRRIATPTDPSQTGGRHRPIIAPEHGSLAIDDADSTLTVPETPLSSLSSLESPDGLETCPQGPQSSQSFDIRSIEPEWSDCIHILARLYTNKIPSRVNKLNRLLIFTADYLADLLPDTNVLLVGDMVSRFESRAKPISQHERLKIVAGNGINSETVWRSALAYTMKKQVFDDGFPYAGMDFAAKGPRDELEQVLRHKGMHIQSSHGGGHN